MVSILFSFCLALAVWFLVASSSLGERGWGHFAVGFFMLGLVGILIPALIVFGIMALRKQPIIIECPECGEKNSIGKRPQSGEEYRCGMCGVIVTLIQTTDN